MSLRKSPLPGLHHLGIKFEGWRAIRDTLGYKYTRLKSDYGEIAVSKVPKNETPNIFKMPGVQVHPCNPSTERWRQEISRAWWPAKPA